MLGWLGKVYGVSEFAPEEIYVYFLYNTTDKNLPLGEI